MSFPKVDTMVYTFKLAGALINTRDLKSSNGIIIAKVVGKIIIDGCHNIAANH